MKTAVGAIAGLIGALLALPAVIETWRGLNRPTWENRLIQIDAIEVARLAGSGKRVVFVDVREPEEFAEFRIPGAISIPLRDLGKSHMEELEGAALVVPYCLKDFRGFEGARVLVKRGLTNVTILDGFGIKSWKREGLPVAGDKPGTTDAQALAQLRARFGAPAEEEPAP